MTNSHVLTCIGKKERKKKSLGGRERVPERCPAVQGLSICYPMRCLSILVKVKLYRLGPEHSVAICYSLSNNRPNATGLCLPQPSGHVFKNRHARMVYGKQSCPL